MTAVQVLTQTMQENLAALQGIFVFGVTWAIKLTLIALSFSLVWKVVSHLFVRD